jgi:DNA-binding CsgD family transcriptional regulator
MEELGKAPATNRSSSLHLPPCFVCGEGVELEGRIGVTGRVRAAYPSGASRWRPAEGVREDTIRMHSPCATQLAAQILLALHARWLAAPGGATGTHLPNMRAAPAALAELTPSERHVLERIAAGDTNEEIAQRLSFAEKTVKNTVGMVLAKLGARSRTEAAVMAVRLGLLE